MTTTLNNSFAEQMNADYEPPTLTRDEVMRIVAERRGGMIKMKEMIDECITCVKQLKETPTDKVFTYAHATGVFGVLDLAELMAQIQMWRKMKCQLLKCNIKEVSCGKQGKATFFTIQPTDKKWSGAWSPLSLSFGTMVSGFTYVCIDPQVAELVWKGLGSKE
jgi:hypothetical protein